MTFSTTCLHKGRISTISHHHNRQLAAILRDLYKELHVSLSSYLNCSLVAGIQQNIQLSDDDELQVRLNAMVIGQHMTEGERQAVKDGATEDAAASSESVTFVPFEDQEDPVLVQLEQQRQQQRKLTHTYSQSAMSQQPDADNEAGTVSTVPVPRQPSFATRLSQVFGGKSASVPRSISGGILGMVQSTRTSSASLGRNVATADAGRVGASSSSVNASKISVSTPIPIAPSPADEIAAPPADPTTAESQPSSFVEITPLTHVPGGTIINYLGHMSLHFVKEDLNLHHHHGNHYTESMHHYADAVLDDGLGTFIHKFLVEIQ